MTTDSNSTHQFSVGSASGLFGFQTPNYNFFVPRNFVLTDSSILLLLVPSSSIDTLLTHCKSVDDNSAYEREIKITPAHTTKK